MIFFWNYRLHRARLLKYLKSPVSEYLWTANMLKGPKDCWNLRSSIFFIFFWLISKEISSKICVLVVSDILRLFANILTPDEKYSLSLKASVLRNQFKSILSKLKNVFSIYFCISRIYIKFEKLWKIIWSS